MTIGVRQVAHTFMTGLLLLVLLPSIAFAATDGDETPADKKPNILLIIGDDMGNETLSCYGLNNSTAKTPTLNSLCDQGVRFNNFWSQPVCSPTRATLLTGRYGFRTGVGRPTGDGEAMGYFPEVPEKPASAPAEDPGRAGGGQWRAPSYGLPLNELTLPMAFKVNDELGYTTAAIGKWHLADRRNGWEHHPNIVGFDYFSGLIRGFPSSFFTWNKVINGAWSGMTGYAPDDKAGDAIKWLDQQEDKPWFLWLAFNLPHSPLHLPPEGLWRSDYSELDPQALPSTNPLPYFQAMIEAMDSEIARVLDSMSEEERANTYIIFMGDNGTASNVVSAPFERGRAKGTVFQGGVNVPMMVAGPGVTPGVSNALVNSTDLFSTILELAGIDIEETIPEKLTLDSVSIVPYLGNPEAESIRDWTYVDYFEGNFAGVANGNYAMRNAEFKLLRHNGNLEFYNLQADPYEHDNLLGRELTAEEQAQYDHLSEKIATLRASH